MQTIKIQTAQNITIDYPVAGLGERILAHLIDYALYAAIAIILGLLTNGFKGPAAFWTLSVYHIIFYTFYVFYDIVTEVFFNGQSLGKYIMKIRVISLDGSRPRLGQYLLRYIFRIVDFVLTAGVGAVVSVAITEKEQRIGDIVAGTTLVKVKSAVTLDELEMLEAEETYEMRFPQISTLSDQDINTVRDIVNNFNKTANLELVDSLAGRVREHLEIETPLGMNNYQFLQTVLKDYSYLSARLT